MKKILTLICFSVLLVATDAYALSAASMASDNGRDDLDRDCSMDPTACQHGGGGGGGGGTTNKPNTAATHFCFNSNEVVGSNVCDSRPSSSTISNAGCRNVACDTCWYCTSCLPGYNLNNGACSSSGSGSGTGSVISCSIPNCLLCASGNRSCTSCEAGYYPTGSTCTQCSQTYLGCKTCNANGCKSCKDGYTATTNSDGYVTCTKNLIISCDIPNCKTCNRFATACTVCNDGYHLSGSACTKCPDHSTACDENGNATACELGYELAVNGQCLQRTCTTCDRGKGISDNISMTCKSCASAYGAGCSTCDCTSCTTCTLGYYFNSSTKQCVRCPDHALSCNDSGRPTLCAEGFELSVTGVCVMPACSTCDNGRGISDNVRQICKTCASEYGTGCSTCNCNSCTACEQGYALKTNALISSGSSSHVSACIKCPDHATSCDGTGNATACEMGYALSNGRCETRGCTTCSGSTPDIGVSVYENGLGMCKMCSSYFNDSNCDKCDCTGCKICKSGNGLNSLGKCTACSSSEMAMTVNGKSKCCSTNAPSGYGTTYVCDRSKDTEWSGYAIGTSAWNAFVNCEIGSMDNYIDEDPTGTCHKVCEIGKYWNGTNCVACNVGAASCDENGNDLLCKTGFTKNMLGQCVRAECRTCSGELEDMGISDNISMTCRTCAVAYSDSHCEKCNCSGCTKCSAGYMLLNGKCSIPQMQMELISCEAPYTKCENENCCELKE